MFVTADYFPDTLNIKSFYRFQNYLQKLQKFQALEYWVIIVPKTAGA
jgi:hypothetical protein